MKSQSYYLGLDLGTTAIKSVVIDETGSFGDIIQRR